MSLELEMEGGLVYEGPTYAIQQLTDISGEI
jgi:hypothetical protein